MPSLHDEVADIVHGARSRSAQIRRQIRRLMRPWRLSQQLFMGEDGQLRPSAAEWLADLGDRCFAERSTFHANDREQVRREARRELYLEILSGLRLDTNKLAALTRQLREADDDD